MGDDDLASKQSGFLHRLLACVLCKKKPKKQTKREWRKTGGAHDEVAAAAEAAAKAAAAAEEKVVVVVEKAVDREKRLKREAEETEAAELAYLSKFAVKIQCMVRRYVAKARKRRRWRQAVSSAEEYWSKVSKGEKEKKLQRRAGKEAKVAFIKSYVEDVLLTAKMFIVQSAACLHIQRIFRGYWSRKCHYVPPVRPRKPKPPKPLYGNLEIARRVWARKEFVPANGWPGMRYSIIVYDLFEHADKPPAGRDYGIKTYKVVLHARSQKEADVLHRNHNAWVGLPVHLQSHNEYELKKKQRKHELMMLEATTPFNKPVVKRKEPDTPPPLVGIKRLLSLGWNKKMVDPDAQVLAPYHGTHYEILDGEITASMANALSKLASKEITFSKYAKQTESKTSVNLKGNSAIAGSIAGSGSSSKSKGSPIGKQKKSKIHNGNNSSSTTTNSINSGSKFIGGDSVVSAHSYIQSVWEGSIVAQSHISSDKFSAANSSNNNNNSKHMAAPDGSVMSLPSIGGWGKGKGIPNKTNTTLFEDEEEGNQGFEHEAGVDAASSLAPLPRLQPIISADSTIKLITPIRGTFKPLSSAHTTALAQAHLLPEQQRKAAELAATIAAATPDFARGGGAGVTSKGSSFWGSVKSGAESLAAAGGGTDNGGTRNQPFEDDPWSRSLLRPKTEIVSKLRFGKRKQKQHFKMTYSWVPQPMVAKAAVAAAAAANAGTKAAFLEAATSSSLRKQQQQMQQQQQYRSLDQRSLGSSSIASALTFEEDDLEARAGHLVLGGNDDAFR